MTSGEGAGLAEPFVIEVATEEATEVPRRTRRSALVSIALAGALGALARYGIGRLVVAAPGSIPWGTFLVNVTGCAAIGIALVVLTERFPSGVLARPLVVTGFIGAYTTFSTYAVGVDELVRTHDDASAALYGLASPAAGLVATIVAVVATRAVVGPRRSRP